MLRHVWHQGAHASINSAFPSARARSVAPGRSSCTNSTAAGDGPAGPEGGCVPAGSGAGRWAEGAGANETGGRLVWGETEEAGPHAAKPASSKRTATERTVQA